MTQPAPRAPRCRHKRVRDLVRRALLQRQPLGEAVDQLREPAEPDQLARRQVGDVRDAPVGEQVMRAHRVKPKAADDDHIGIGLTFDRLAQDLRRIHVVAGEKLRLPTAAPRAPACRRGRRRAPGPAPMPATAPRRPLAVPARATRPPPPSPAVAARARLRRRWDGGPRTRTRRVPVADRLFAQPPAQQDLLAAAARRESRPARCSMSFTSPPSARTRSISSDSAS